jgi:hypothetical protein
VVTSFVLVSRLLSLMMRVFCREAAAGALAQAAPGGGDALGMVTSEFHIHSHLLVGGGASGHVGPRPESRGPDPARTHAATRDKGENPCRRFGQPTVGLRPPFGHPNRPSYVSLTGQLRCRGTFEAVQMIYVLELWVSSMTQDLDYVVDRSREPMTTSDAEDIYMDDGDAVEGWLAWEGKRRLALWPPLPDPDPGRLPIGEGD